eukprot:gene10376-12529_t
MALPRRLRSSEAHQKLRGPQWSIPGPQPSLLSYDLLIVPVHDETEKHWTIGILMIHHANSSGERDRLGF